MFCTTIVFYGVFAGVLLGITDGQRLDQNCRSLMMGRAFGYTNPTSDAISVTFTVYSDTANAQVQLTDNSGTETKNILAIGDRFLEVIFTRTISGEGLLLEADADVGVSVQYQLGGDLFDLRLLCVADTLSQHFTPGIHGYTEIGVMSLDADNNVTETYLSGDATSSSTHNLQERETLHLPINGSTISVLCSGRCVVYRHFVNTTSPVMPVQFYAADYYLKSSNNYTLSLSAVEKGATASVVTVNRAIQILQANRHVSAGFTGLVNGSARVDTLTCSTGCVVLTDIGLANNRFFSPPESTNGSLIRSTGNTWMIVFDYDITENRTFQDVYSLEPISPTPPPVASSSFVTSSTEFLSSIRGSFKYVFVDAPSGVYRISNISYIGSSAIYVHDVTDEDNFIVPLYAANQTYPIDSIDLCNRPEDLCPVTESCVNVPENYTYSCQPVTTTTEPVTTTTEAATTTTQAATTTTQAATTTTEAATTTTQAATTTTQAATTTTQAATTTTQAATTTTEAATTTTQAATTTTEAATMTTQAATTTTQAATMTTQAVTMTTQAATTTTNATTTTTEAATTTTQAATTTTQAATMTTEAATTTTEAATMTTQAVTMTTQAATTTTGATTTATEPATVTTTSLTTTSQSEIDECASNPCQNSVSCTDGIDSFFCTCMEGFTGVVCETDIDECESSPCLNGGTCNNRINGFTCDCAVGFTNGILGICETIVERVPGYSKRREGRFKECAQLLDPQTSNQNVTSIEECGIKCSENEEFCSAFVFGPDERCTLTKAICESQNTTGELFLRNGIEFERLSTFNFEVFMDKRDSRESKHHLFALKFLPDTTYNPILNGLYRGLIDNEHDLLAGLLYRSKFVVDLKLDHVESGSVLAVYDVLVDSVTQDDLIAHVESIIEEFSNRSALEVVAGVFRYNPTDPCSKLTGFCLNGGSCRWNALEGAVYCQCPAAFNGDKCQNPVVNVTSIFPIRGSGPFGPESGGTRITMMGSHLQLTGFPVVELGGFVCPLNSSSPVEIVCETARVTNVDALGTGLPITVRWPPENHPLPQGILQTKYSFVYLEDPDISTVHPLRTIVGGGVDLTVTGENMDSVASPVMEMLIFSAANLTRTLINRYLVVCELRSPTVFVCPTAQLNLTEANRRRKRETEFNTRYVYKGEEVEIQINFFLDGVQEFRNMSEARPEYSTIVVYINPKFSKVEGMEIFRPYWPFDDEYLIRTGENLLDGLGESQYNVFVGKERCTEVEVYPNSITCRAPTSEPDKNDFHDHPELMVLIGRGNVNFQLGEIQYEKHLMQYRPAQIIFGVALFLIILIILIVFLCCRYKRNKFRDVPRSQGDGEEPLDISRPKLNSTGPPIKSKYLNYEPKDGRKDPGDGYLELVDSDTPPKENTFGPSPFLNAARSEPKEGYLEIEDSDSPPYLNSFGDPSPYLKMRDSDAPGPYIRDNSEYRPGAAVATVYSNPGAYSNNVPGNYLAPSRGPKTHAYDNAGLK